MTVVETVAKDGGEHRSHGLHVSYSGFCIKAGDCFIGNGVAVKVGIPEYRNGMGQISNSVILFSLSN